MSIYSYDPSADWIICELCGQSFETHDPNQECCDDCINYANRKSKSPWQDTTVRTDDKDNIKFMLAFVGISQEDFDQLTPETLGNWLDDTYGYQDPKRSCWHHYRAKAFTKQDKLRQNVLAKLDPDRKALMDAAKAETKNAPESLFEKQERKQRELLKAKREVAKEAGLLALSGSFKQKKWAEDIRKLFIEMLQCNNPQALYPALNEKDALRAKFWIETRYCNFETMTALLLGNITYKSAVDETNRKDNQNRRARHL